MCCHKANKLFTCVYAPEWNWQYFRKDENEKLRPFAEAGAATGRRIDPSLRGHAHGQGLRSG